MAPPSTRTRSGLRADLLTVAAGVGLVVLAVVVGRDLLANGIDLFLGWPPLLAIWLPHVGPGTPVAVAVAVLVVARGPETAARLGWRPLLGAAYVASALWTLALAMVDGWQRGVVERLSSSQEYLHDVPRVTDIGAMLRTFDQFILTDQPGHWTTHVGAHPPGVFLFYVVLDRLGLGDGGSAGVVTVLIGASAGIAVAVAVRALSGEDLARRMLPFAVLFPGAVWVGVSADGMFAAVLAWGVALLAIGSTGPDADRSGVTSLRLDRSGVTPLRSGWTGGRADLAALAGGVLLGWALYQSYGLVLGGLVALAAARRWRTIGFAALGVGAVVLAFTLAGFWWFTGLGHVRVIYAASAAAGRPYDYFVWANLAAVAFAVGPAALAGIRRAVASPRALPLGALLLAAGGLAALLAADLSGLSKAEVERIWLPFAIWLTIPCALLPRARPWLAAQAGLALAVNHLLLTVW